MEWLDLIRNPRVVLCGGESAAAYLVQAVQSRAFPVPLISGEDALLRVFATAAQDNKERLPPVRASFHLNGALAHVADIPGKPGPIPTDVDEGSLTASVNSVIPGEVVQTGLEIVIEIDPDGTLDAGLGVAKRIPATGRMPELADGNGSSSFAFVLPVQTAWADALASITLSGPRRIGHLGRGEQLLDGHPARPTNPTGKGHSARFPGAE